MTKITEIAPDVFRISTFIPEFNLQFAQFLVRDDEPMLIHSGMKALFPIVKEEVGKLIDIGSLKWIGFSHFEADECGSLPEWQLAAPNATAVCSLVGKLVSVDDFSGQEAKGMSDGDRLSTGKYSFRFISTPQVPHCWEAGQFYEETNGTLFCSDLLHQNGDTPAITEDVGVIGACRETFVEYQKGPFADYMPYTVKTDGILRGLAGLQPKNVATMHGSVFVGDGEKVLNDYADMRLDLDAS